MTDDFLICDEAGCSSPIVLVGFDTEVDGSYCTTHLDKRMREAGVIGNE